MRFPPVIPFNKCFMDITLRHVMSFDKQPINSWQTLSLTPAMLFNGPWDILRSCFSETKVKRINVYAMAGVGYDERGYHALNVAPKAEFNITSNVKFQTFLSLPGTKADRISRSLHGTWFPTSPAERVWFPIGSVVTFVDMVYISTSQVSSGSASASFPLEITIDAHVRVRGVKYHENAAKFEQQQLGADMDFVRIA